MLVPNCYIEIGKWFFDYCVDVEIVQERKSVV